MKKLMLALALTALISLSGCGNTDKQNAASDKNSTVSSANTEAQSSKTTADNKKSSQEDSYKFIEEASTELSSESKSTSSSDKPLSVKDFKGIWKPLAASRVADNSEAGFNEVFGSSYSQGSCKMEIDENGSFTMSMDSLAEDEKNKGTFTMSSYNMIVTYTDGSPDTFLYIPKYQNQQTIKIQLGKYYIYLYKEV